MHDFQLIEWLSSRLAQPLPGWRAQTPFQPELSYGRHFAPPPASARPAAVMLLLYPLDGRWTIPLTLRPAEMLDHASQISLPGGSIDPGERSEDAARRELEEELGVAPADLKLLGQLSPIYLFNSNFFVTPWLAAVAARPAWSPNPAEVAELIEAPLDALRAADAQITWQRSFASITAAVPGLQFGSHCIWGGTCMLLAELLVLVDEFYASDRADCTDGSGPA